MLSQMRPLVFDLLVMEVGFVCLGAMVAWAAGIFSAFLVTMINYWMGGVFNRRLGVVTVGGLAGFLPTFIPVFVWYQLTPTFSPSVWGVLLVIAIPFFAVMFGQLGAVWMANKNATWSNLGQELEYRTKHPQPAFQFKTIHLLKLMVLLSFVLALNQLSSRHEFLFILLCYSVIQIFWLMIDRFYFARWQHKSLVCMMMR